MRMPVLVKPISITKLLSKCGEFGQYEVRIAAHDVEGDVVHVIKRGCTDSARLHATWR